MAARVRDHGKLSYKRVSGKSDRRSKRRKGAHSDSPEEIEFEADTIYDPSINEQLANDYVEKQLNEADKEYSHFDVSDLEFIEGETEEEVKE